MNSKAVFIYGFSKGRDLPHTMKAVNIAHILHYDQKRKDGTDYVEHVIGTAHLLISHGVEDDEMLAAAILHDAIEDTEYTYEKIVADFNDKIASFVRILSKEENIGLDEYFRKIGEFVELICIKGADRTHNISDMVKSFSIEKMKEYVEETEVYILPMMKKARKMNIKHGDLCVALTEHINAVILVIKELIRISEFEKSENAS